jgi:ribonuclease-3
VTAKDGGKGRGGRAEPSRGHLPVLDDARAEERSARGDPDALQARLGHFFKNTSLLDQALTHPSASLEAGRSRLLSYERLEFLGDAVANLLIAELLFNRFPKEEEGVLTKLRAYWVSRPVLAAAAKELLLHRHLALGEGEERSGGRAKERILASALEALFGALYLDAGLKVPARLASALWADAIRKRGLEPLAEDAKTLLQERRQAAGLPLPRYRTEPEDDGFACTVLLDDEPAGTGAGPSRKAAEQAAARAALKRLSQEG